jgi:hypothetical protein
MSCYRFLRFIREELPYSVSNLETINICSHCEVHILEPFVIIRHLEILNNMFHLYAVGQYNYGVHP